MNSLKSIAAAATVSLLLAGCVVTPPTAVFLPERGREVVVSPASPEAGIRQIHRVVNPGLCPSDRYRNVDIKDLDVTAWATEEQITAGTAVNHGYVARGGMVCRGRKGIPLGIQGDSLREKGLLRTVPPAPSARHRAPKAPPSVPPSVPREVPKMPPAPPRGVEGMLFAPLTLRMGGGA